jgi:hypothetical protein
MITGLMESIFSTSDDPAGTFEGCTKIVNEMRATIVCGEATEV